MHDRAFMAVQRARDELSLQGLTGTVLDVGGRDVNGTARSLFPFADYTVLDLRPGDDVDIVADARHWAPDRLYDVVLSTETFEHMDGWQYALSNMFDALRPGGALIVTAAADPRQPHSALDGCELRPGEEYRNVRPDELLRALIGHGLHQVTVEWKEYPGHGGDVYAWGVTLNPS